LDLTVFNARSWGVTSVVRVPLATRTVVSLPEGLEVSGYAITCQRRGLLERTQDSTFITSTAINMNMITERRRVEVPERSKRRGKEIYTVGVAGIQDKIVVGTPRAPSATQRLAEDEGREKTARRWASLDVKWFYNQTEEATQELRQIVGSARRSVELVDPYFGAKDVLSIAVATSSHSVPVRILTWKDFCVDWDAGLGMEQGEALLRALKGVHTQEPRLNISARVMMGKGIHDRLLIVDGVVYVLGNSCNQLGDRGSLVIKLPNAPSKDAPDPRVLDIREDVFERAWNGPSDEVMELGAFVERQATLRAEQRRNSRDLRARIKNTSEAVRRLRRTLLDIWRA
jgi:hypothetical protein